MWRDEKEDRDVVAALADGADVGTDESTTRFWCSANGFGQETSRRGALPERVPPSRRYRPRPAVRDFVVALGDEKIQFS